MQKQKGFIQFLNTRKIEALRREKLHVSRRILKKLDSSYEISPDCHLFFEKGYYNRLEKLLYNWQKLN